MNAPAMLSEKPPRVRTTTAEPAYVDDVNDVCSKLWEAVRALQCGATHLHDLRTALGADADTSHEECVTAAVEGRKALAAEAQEKESGDALEMLLRLKRAIEGVGAWESWAQHLAPIIAALEAERAQSQAIATQQRSVIDGKCSALAAEKRAHAEVRQWLDEKHEALNNLGKRMDEAIEERDETLTSLRSDLAVRDAELATARESTKAELLGRLREALRYDFPTLHGATEAVFGLYANRERIREQLAKTQGVVERLGLDAAEALKILAERDATIGELDGQLNHYNREMDALGVEVGCGPQLFGVVAEKARRRIVDLKHSLATANESCEHWQLTAEAKERAHNSTTRERNRAICERDEARRESVDLREKLAKEEATVALLQERVNTLEVSLDESVSESDDLREKLRQAETLLVERTGERDRAAISRDSYRDERDTARAESASLTERLAEVERELSAYRGASGELALERVHHDRTKKKLGHSERRERELFAEVQSSYDVRLELHRSIDKATGMLHGALDYTPIQRTHIGCVLDVLTTALTSPQPESGEVKRLGDGLWFAVKGLRDLVLSQIEYDARNDVPSGDARRGSLQAVADQLSALLAAYPVANPTPPETTAAAAK